MEIIKTKNLSYEYGKNYDNDENNTLLALNDINLTIDKGSFVAILGRNGSGKSTFAKHMNSIFIPTSGTIWVNGYDSKNQELIYEIRKNVGMVFQNPDNQIVATVVEEDVAFGLENLGIPREEMRKRIDSSLETVSMKKYLKHSPHMLSGGQKQRVAIAGVLAMKPECIVLDEPTAMLDPTGRKEVIQTITRLNKEENITIVLITHYVDEAAKADRVIVMNDGVVEMDGTPKDILTNVEKMEQYGLDSPQTTRLAKSLINKGVNLPDNILTINELIDSLCMLREDMQVYDVN